MLTNLNGVEQLTIFRGRTGAGFVVEMYKGKTQDSGLLATDIRDGAGNVLKRTAASGLINTFRPHNCQRVVGRCEYTHDSSTLDTPPAKMIRETRPKSRGFEFSLHWAHPNGGLTHVSSGSVSRLDPLGFTVRAKGRNGPKKRDAFSLKKLRASWD